jgi:hypothetical protein
MKLSEANYDNAETGCCARLDEARWDGQRVTWKDKPFLRDHVRAWFHVPLNLGRVLTRDHAAISAAEAYAEEPLWLSDEDSLWGTDLYIAVDRDVPGAQIEKLSGTFVTKVFEGPYKDAGKWARKMGQYVRQQGLECDKLYFFYATCPRCGKHFGRNQVVLFAQVH